MSISGGSSSSSDGSSSEGDSSGSTDRYSVADVELGSVSSISSKSSSEEEFGVGTRAVVVCSRGIFKVKFDFGFCGFFNTYVVN